MPISRLQPASIVPLTCSEIAQARAIIQAGPLCVARIQRRMKIGWSRASDLAEYIVGFDALPEVAKRSRSARS